MLIALEAADEKCVEFVYRQLRENLAAIHDAILLALSVEPKHLDLRVPETPNLGRAATPAEVAGWDISIAPDGRGLPSLQSDDRHYGLSIMRERANSLGGELALEPREDGGTRVSVSFAPHRMTPEPAARGDG